MDNKKIKKIAEKSFINNKLNKDIVDFILKKLKRSEIKKYIKALKQIEKKNKIYLVLPETSNHQGIEYVLSYLKKKYPNKEIEIQKDPKLISGIRILNDDVIYDYNIKDALNNLVNYINNPL